MTQVRVVLFLHRPRLHQAGRGVGSYAPSAPYPHVWREKAALAKASPLPPAAPVCGESDLESPSPPRHRRATPSTHAHAYGWGVLRHLAYMVVFVKGQWCLGMVLAV
jgi:hypothetical protein